MALDFTELLAQRSASNIDFVMKVSIDAIKLNTKYVWVEKMLNNTVSMQIVLVYFQIQTL